MKNRIYILLLVAFCFASCSKKGIVKISGEIANLHTSELYIYGQDGSFDKVDTVPVVNGKINCKIMVDTLSAAYILINNEAEYPIYFEKGDHIRIKGDANKLQDLKITGNDANDDFEDFKKELNKANCLNRLTFTNMEMFDATLQSQAQTFISKHGSSPVSAYLLDKFFLQQGMPDYPRIKQIIAGLDRSLRESPRISKINDYIIRWEKSRMGAVAPTFSLPDNLHGMITRNSPQLKDKYILLAFWASWTSNRAQTSADMRQIYHAFHNNSKFVMVNISLDTDKATWTNSVRQDTIQGLQVCDLNGFNSPLVTSFAVSSLPTYFFIAPDGVILARDMMGDALKRQIAAALK